jgi:hypothetical protein
MTDTTAEPLSPVARALIASLRPFLNRPEKLRAQLNGLLLDGSLPRAVIRSGLEPFMRLPPAEARRRTRARMAQAIAERFTLTGQVTEDDLARAGFTHAEIRDLFTEAKRASGVEQMVI